MSKLRFSKIFSDLHPSGFQSKTFVFVLISAQPILLPNLNGKDINFKMVGVDLLLTIWSKVSLQNSKTLLKVTVILQLSKECLKISKIEPHDIVWNYYPLILQFKEGNHL